MSTTRFAASILAGWLVLACRRTPVPDPVGTTDAGIAVANPSPRDAGGATLTVAGVPLAIVLPPGVGMSDGTYLLHDAGFAPQTVADGVVTLEPLGRQVGTPPHTRSWTLDVTRPGPLPASLDAAKALALAPDPRSPAQTLLGAEVLAAGGFLVTTRSADRILVTSWHPNGQKHVECTGEDLREDDAPNPSWLDAPAELQAARAGLEAPCRSLRVQR